MRGAIFDSIAPALGVLADPGVLSWVFVVRYFELFMKFWMFRASPSATPSRCSSGRPPGP